MQANRRNFRVCKEIWVEEHDGYVRFKNRSRNMAVSSMRNASGHNYRNSSFIVNLATGQIPCALRPTTERISSFIYTRCSAIAERPRCRVHYSFRQK